METIAVFVAFGGGAYAAVKITGRVVDNRSLTSKDIKKRSVPLNRLKGRRDRGRRGVQGPQGPRPAARSGAAGVTTGDFANLTLRDESSCRR